MTSQTVIINKNLTINVSDKNGTNENDKSYGGHRKIIKLRNDPPVSLMYNGNVEFEGISIENLVHKNIEEYEFCRKPFFKVFAQTEKHILI